MLSTVLRFNNFCLFSIHSTPSSVIPILWSKEASISVFGRNFRLGVFFLYTVFMVFIFVFFPVSASSFVPPITTVRIVRYIPSEVPSHLQIGLRIVGNHQSLDRIIDILDLRVPQNGALTHQDVPPRFRTTMLIL